MQQKLFIHADTPFPPPLLLHRLHVFLQVAETFFQSTAWLTTTCCFWFVSKIYHNCHVHTGAVSVCR